MKKNNSHLLNTILLFFLQIKDQAVAIQSAPSKDFIVSNLEPVSAHTILAGTLNVKVDLKENGSDTPKNKTPKNNDSPTDYIILCIYKQLIETSQMTVLVFQTIFQTVL